MKPAFLLTILATGCVWVTGCGPREARAPSAGQVPGRREAPADPALLTNGLIGLRLGADGFAPVEPAPTPPDGGAFFHADVIQLDGEEKLEPLPSPLQVQLFFAGRRLAPAGAGEFSYSFREAATTHRYAADGVEVEVMSTMHPLLPVVVQSVTLRPSRSGVLRLEERSEATAKLVGGAIEVPADARAPARRVRYSPQVVLREAGEGRFDAEISLSREPITFYREVGWGAGPRLAKLSRGNLTGLPAWRTAVTPAEVGAGPEAAFDAVLRANGQFERHPIELVGPEEDQQALMSLKHWTRRSVHPYVQVGPGPFGVTNRLYNGHVFWDADIWVFPALAILDPERAREIPDYRLGLAEGYAGNFARWQSEGAPTSEGRMAGFRPTRRPALMVPWESSVSGRETVPGPSRNQHHITGSALWMLHQAAWLGLAEPAAVTAFGKRAAEFWRVRSVPGPTGLEVRGVMSPDEHHQGNNDLYTNLLAEWTRRTYGGEPTVAYKRPRDAQGLLTYDNDRLRGYKQAAAVLAVYPLQDPEAEKSAETMLGRFADQVIENGPAMTDSVHATILARLGKVDAAYEAWHQSWKPFMNGPQMLFSEKRNRPKTHFVTGSAGSLQTVIYGFAGFRLDSRQDPSAAWSKPLRGGGWLNLKPHLPPTWTSLTLRDIRILDQTLTFTLDRQSDGSTRVRVQ